MVSTPQCVKRMLDEFLDVMFKELPSRKWIDHIIKVMSRMTPPTKVPYWMNEKLQELNIQFEIFFAKKYIKPNKSPYGHSSFSFTRRMKHWGCAWIIKPSTRWQWKINIHYLELTTCLINFRELNFLVGLTYIWDIIKFEL
jgi:hypothetical protein